MSWAVEAGEMPGETRQIHTRLMKCTLAVDESRAYWERARSDVRPTYQVAFDEYWFGARSLAWVKELIINMRARFDAFPEALEVLHSWEAMAPEDRTAICHWHLQLSDPLYRAFSGEYLVERRNALKPEVSRKPVIGWVADRGSHTWTVSTRTQFASKLLSAAFSAGLVGGRRDPRPLTFPRVSDRALSYLMYLLRGVSFEGSLTENPYLRSVGLEGAFLERRLAVLPGLRYRSVGDVIEFDWRYGSLTEWARAELPLAESASL